jgi:hypothetical protein
MIGRLVSKDMSGEVNPSQSFERNGICKMISAKLFSVHRSLKRAL